MDSTKAFTPAKHKEKTQAHQRKEIEQETSSGLTLHAATSLKHSST